MPIGVLAWQGDFSKHLNALASLGVEGKEVRGPRDLDACSGLIIPGGESTVLARQMEFIAMRAPLLEFSRSRPLFGTCAGLILLASSAYPFSFQPLGVLDVVVERNAFGRQLDSFWASISLELAPPEVTAFPAFFIRAPRIRHCRGGVSVLASLEGEPVLVRQGHHLGATFHPELTLNLEIHRYFVQLAEQGRRDSSG